MQFGNISDLGQSLMLRRQGANLQENLTRLTEELTTGLRQDISTHVKGDFSALAGLERTLSRLDGFALARNDLELRVSGMQMSLSALQDVASTVGTDILSAASLEQSDVLDAKIADTSSRFDQVVSFLNTQVSGQYLFAGDASDQLPIVSSNDIMTQVRLMASSAVDVADFQAQVDTWFLGSGAGYNASAYGGSDQYQTDILISETQKIDIPIKANDLIFRSLLRDLAVASVISEGGLVATESEKREILIDVGEGLITAENTLIGLQRDTGVTESLLTEASVAAEVERTALNLAHGKIVSADPYEAASELEAVQYQIEILYTLTARASQLRLTDYL